MKLIGLVSCYNEGHLLDSTVRSAVAACDQVGVFEGPVGKEYGVHPEPKVLADMYPEGSVHVVAARRYKDDADKRNVALRWAQARQADWVLWLDGDEVLIWPEYLRDWIERAQYVTGVGGFQIRIVELDGSVVFSNGRIVKADMVRRYLLAASQVELKNGMVIALPHELLCSAGGMPVAPEGRQWNELEGEEMAHWLGRCRPPVGGEPHILHRSLLRDPNRGVQRQHLPEAEWFEEQGQGDPFARIDTEPPRAPRLT